MDTMNFKAEVKSNGSDNLSQSRNWIVGEGLCISSDVYTPEEVYKTICPQITRMDRKAFYSSSFSVERVEGLKYQVFPVNFRGKHYPKILPGSSLPRVQKLSQKKKKMGG